MLGEANASKLAALSLSNNTIHRRIIDMSEDIKLQVISEVQAATLGYSVFSWMSILMFLHVLSQYPLSGV